MNEYKLPDPPNNPVVDWYGRTWYPDVPGWWKCNKEGELHWSDLVKKYGPLKDAPKKPTREDIMKIAVAWESGKKANHWVDEVWDLVKDWTRMSDLDQDIEKYRKEYNCAVANGLILRAQRISNIIMALEALRERS